MMVAPAARSSGFTTPMRPGSGMSRTKIETGDCAGDNPSACRYDTERSHAAVAGEACGVGGGENSSASAVGRECWRPRVAMGAAALMGPARSGHAPTEEVLSQVL